LEDDKGLTKETRTFLIKLKIKDSDGQIKELSKKQEIEIDFDDKVGRASSVKERGKGGDLVTFEKDDKEYDIIVRIDEIKKGPFRDLVEGYGFEKSPPDAPFEIWKEYK